MVRLLVVGYVDRTQVAVTAVEDCGCKLPGVAALAGIKRVGGR